MFLLHSHDSFPSAHFCLCFSIRSFWTVLLLIRLILGVPSRDKTLSWFIHLFLWMCFICLFVDLNLWFSHQGLCWNQQISRVGSLCFWCLNITNIIAVVKQTLLAIMFHTFSPHMPSNPPLSFSSGLQHFVFSPQCWLSVQPALG